MITQVQEKFFCQDYKFTSCIEDELHQEEEDLQNVDAVQLDVVTMVDLLATHLFEIWPIEPPVLKKTTPKL